MEAGLAQEPQIQDFIQQTKIVSEEQAKILDKVKYPSNLGEFVGQTDLIKRLNIHIKASKLRKSIMKHILLYGPPGLGKTTVAELIAEELGTDIIHTSGRLLRSIESLEEALDRITTGSILFIDEIHGLSKKMTDIFLPILQDRRYGDRNLPEFTLVGSSTSISHLQKAFRDRFATWLELRYYDRSEIETITCEYAYRKYSIKLSKGVAKEISARSHGIPRIAKRLTDILKDYVDVEFDFDMAFIPNKTAIEAFAAIDIDEYGLESTHRRIINYLYLHARPIGKETLRMALSIDEEDLEELFEPVLLRTGLIEKTPRGRELSDGGRAYAMKLERRQRQSIRKAKKEMK